MTYAKERHFSISTWLLHPTILHIITIHSAHGKYNWNNYTSLVTANDKFHKWEKCKGRTYNGLAVGERLIKTILKAAIPRINEF